MESNFIDYVKIYCRSGRGGRGSTHMHRAKYIPKGGPDGGNGGRGGHVILRGNRNYWTLLHLRYDRHIQAEHGGNGSKNKSTGHQGADRYIDVPCGTVVYNAETGEYICDVTEHGQEVVLLRGGRGGLGNFNFATPTNQAPRYAQPGEPMQELTVILELKLLADVGLVGLPNAGKSTLVNALSSAKPKIGDYPFTTLEPSLGIVAYREGCSFVIADIPGIIEGASEGRGLGLRFLRHIERNSILLFMVAADAEDIRREYDTLLGELRQYNPELLDKSRILAITKCDLIGHDPELMEMLRENLPDDIPTIFISSVSNFNMQELKDLLWKELNSESNKIAAVTTSENILKKTKDLPHLVCFDDEEDDQGWADEFEHGEQEDSDFLDDDIEDMDEDSFEYVDTSDDE
jgi:GTP-binding protein